MLAKEHSVLLIFDECREGQRPCMSRWMEKIGKMERQVFSDDIGD